MRQDAGTATRDVIQIRHLFEADGKGSYRKTVEGWHSADINGKNSLRKAVGT
jgi:hypothetical protein